jgi:phage protein D/phage baseplate assembly protein gpV
MPETAHQSHCYVYLNGTILPEAYMDALMSVEVDDSLYLPDMFTIMLSDRGLGILTGTIPGPGFKLGDGVEIKVALRENGPKVKLLEGEITSIEPDINSSDRGTLTVRGYDRSHRLMRGRKTETFLNVKDSDVASRLAQSAGLQANADDTGTVHKYMIQSNQTNYEFLSERAKRNGFQLYVEDRTLFFKRPPAAPPVGPTLDWGINLDQFRARVSTTDQVNRVVVRGYNPANKQAIVGSANSPSSQSQVRTYIGKNGGQAAQSAFGMEATQTIIDRPVSDMGEANRIAQAELDARSANFFQAEGSAGGDPAIKAGAKITINGVGTNFAGEYLVTRSIHRYSSRGYTTHFWCNGGKSSTSITEILKSSNGNSAQHRVGAAEHVTTRGLMVGIVTDNNDPENLGRVKVKFPTYSDNIESWWCRLATIMAGNNRGVAYFPEVNDEVIVGFEHGDPTRGCVLGAVWNGSDTLPKPIGQLVSGGQTIRRVTRTRKGHEFILIDEPGQEGIHLIDRTTKNFIKIITDDNKIHIECTGDVEVKTTTGNINATAQTGNVTVQASAGKVTLQAMQDLELTAQAGRVKINGTAGVEINSPAVTKVTGAGMLELTSGGITAVKGSMLKLN